MLGHCLVQVCQKYFDTWVSMRSDFARKELLEIYDPQKTYTNLDIVNFQLVQKAVNEVRPDVIINAVGIVKQSIEAKNPVTSITVNSLFPHRLSELCAEYGVKLIHISTDCVFTGRKGMYTENDVPDAEDLYGRSKLLGEVQNGHALTLRTSFIGNELYTKYGLLEWFIDNKGKQVNGYENAIFSGLTSQALSHVLIDIVKHHRNLQGLYHLSCDPISKSNLLHLINEIYGLGVDIKSDYEVSYDHSLDSSRYRELTGWVPQPWESMIESMRENSLNYPDRRIVN